MLIVQFTFFHFSHELESVVVDDIVVFRSLECAEHLIVCGQSILKGFTHII